MGGRVIAVRVGGVELLVETSPLVPAGSESTSSADAVRQKAVEAFDRAQDAIVAVAESVADTVGRLTDRAVRPDRVQVEFGVRFAAEASVMVAAASGEATLRVLLSYDASRTV